MKNFNEKIEVTNVVTELITIKKEIKDSTLSKQQKLNLNIKLNKKVCLLKISEATEKLNERNEKSKPLNEKGTFKKNVKLNLHYLNNIVATIKKSDKSRLFEGKEIASKYRFLFSKGFSNTTFYGLITLSQFNKLITKGEFFNSDTITENCERLAKKNYSEIESILLKGQKIKTLVENKEGFTTVHLLELFNKL